MISLALILGGTVWAVDLTEEQTLYEQMVLQENCLEAYNAIYATFEMTDNLEYVFPSEYGGEYLTEDGKLMILLVGRTPELESLYRMKCNNSPYVVFGDAEYSLQELINIQKSVRSDYDKFQVSKCMIDMEENAVIMEVSEDSSLINSASTYSVSSPIIVRVETDNAVATAAVHGGDKLQSGNKLSSVGWSGSYNGLPAVVSCGHGKAVGNTYSIKCPSLSNSIGTATVQVNEVGEEGVYNAYGDYSILTIDSGCTTSNKLHYNDYATKSVTSYQYSVPQNYTIYYCSQTSSSNDTLIEKQGTVISSYTDMEVETLSYNGDGIIIRAYGIIVAEGADRPIGGDSGGPVYCKYSNGDIGAVGLITAVTSSGLLFSPLRYPISAGFTLRLN